MIGLGSARHEHDSVTIVATQVRKVFENFFGIQDGADDELDLILSFGHQRLDHLGRVPESFVFANPSFTCIAFGVGVAEFGADRPEVATCVSIEGTCCLDRDVFTSAFQFTAKIRQGFEDHRFSPGDHDVFDPKVFDLPKDFFDAQGVTFGFPGRVAGIAIPTAQIAAAGANKNARRTSQEAFALNALENLGNPDQSMAFYKRFCDKRGAWTLLYFVGIAKILQALTIG